MNMQKLWKALATAALLVLLYLPGSPVSEYSLPKIPWVIVFVLTLTYGASLFLSAQIHAHRRWGIAYLGFTGLIYLLAGMLGLGEGGLVEPQLWRVLISPYPLTSFIEQWAHHFPYGTSRAPYTILPDSGENEPFVSEHHLVSVAVVVLSLTAIAAAFAMAKRKRWAYRAWFVLLCLFAVEFSGYVIVCFFSWGPEELLIPFCVTVSYVLAFLMARAGVDFQWKSATGQAVPPSK